MAEAPIHHLMFDTETLAKNENAIVLTLGCIVFTYEEKLPYKAMIRDGFYVKFSVKDQIQNYKRNTDPDTIAWWKKQSAEARAAGYAPSPDDATMIDGLTALSKFIGQTKYSWQKSYLWARGPQFDFPKIESMYDQADLKLPFNSWKIRDVRTYIDILAGVDNGQYKLKGGEIDGFVKHNSLHDAAKDVMCMKEIYQSCLGPITEDDIPY